MNETRLDRTRPIDPGAVEHCLVVPRERLVSRIGGLPSGFRPGGVEDVLDTVSAWGRFVPRTDAEVDPALKQIIPYCVVGYREDIFLMRRRRGGGEHRLHDKLSLGVGGHVNPIDAARGGDLRLTATRALEREIREELHVDSPARTMCLGLLNDDSNEVGQVHLGLVYRLDVERPDVRVREEDRLEGRFVDRSVLLAAQGRMETWSRILAPLIVEGRWARRHSSSERATHEATEGSE